MRGEGRRGKGEGRGDGSFALLSMTQEKRCSSWCVVLRIRPFSPVPLRPLRVLRALCGKTLVPLGVLAASSPLSRPSLGQPLGEGVAPGGAVFGAAEVEGEGAGVTSGGEAAEDVAEVD